MSVLFKRLKRFQSFAKGGSLPARKRTGDEVPVLLSACAHAEQWSVEEMECPCWPDCLEERE